MDAGSNSNGLRLRVGAFARLAPCRSPPRSGRRRFPHQKTRARDFACRTKKTHFMVRSISGLRNGQVLRPSRR